MPTPNLGLTLTPDGNTAWGTNERGNFTLIDTFAGTTAPAAVSTAVKTANYTAAAGDYVRCDVSSAGFNITLPTGLTNGKEITVKIVAGATNSITMVASGADTIEVSSFYGLGTSVTFVYDGVSHWYVK